MKTSQALMRRYELNDNILRYLGLVQETYTEQKYKCSIFEAKL